MRSILVFLMTAFLATPIASAETIHACAHKKNGKLRLVAAAGQCTGKEAVVSWNSAGPSGEKGDKGEPGDSECAAAPAAPTEFALVGITQATFDGFNLKWTFDEGCDAEFPNSRLCGSEEETISPLLLCLVRRRHRMHNSPPRRTERPHPLAPPLHELPSPSQHQPPEPIHTPTQTEATPSRPSPNQAVAEPYRELMSSSCVCR